LRITNHECSEDFHIKKDQTVKPFLIIWGVISRVLGLQKKATYQHKNINMLITNSLYACRSHERGLSLHPKSNRMKFEEKQKICVPDLLRLIPDEQLSRLAGETKVDYCTKVLYGRSMFYLLLYALLQTEHTSQRTPEDIFRGP
jgi:hypothetical protein